MKNKLPAIHPGEFLAEILRRDWRLAGGICACGRRVRDAGIPCRHWRTTDHCRPGAAVRQGARPVAGILGQPTGGL